jgi:magnesium transporter
MKKNLAFDKLTKNVPVVKLEDSVSEIESILKNNDKFESISYIYVVNDKNELLGYFSIKELFVSDKVELVAELIKKQESISVQPSMELHKVALKAISNDLTALPVIDTENHFLGAITTENIIKTLDSKSVEQILRHGGISIKHKPDVFNTPLLTSLKHRLPWLMVGLFGGIATAGIVNSFEKTLEENIVLAMFIPLIVYMADAIGNQMEAFIIRDLDQNPKLNFGKYIYKQLEIIGIIALILSILVFVVSLVIFNTPKVSIVIAIGLFAASISSVFTGVIIPYTFSKLKQDPADASGPIATIIQDFSSLVIYFTIATILL